MLRHAIEKRTVLFALALFALCSLPLHAQRGGMSGGARGSAPSGGGGGMRSAPSSGGASRGSFGGSAPSASRPSFSGPSTSGSRGSYSSPPSRGSYSGPSSSPGRVSSGSPSSPYGGSTYRSPSPSVGSPSVGSRSNIPVYRTPTSETGSSSGVRIGTVRVPSGSGSSSIPTYPTSEGPAGVRGSSSLPTIEPTPARVRFPQPYSGSGSSTGSTRDTGAIPQGPSSRRLRSGSEVGVPAEVFESSRSVNREAILERYRRDRETNEPSFGASARNGERPGTIAGRVPTGPSRRVANARGRNAAIDPGFGAAVEPTRTTGRTTDPRITGARARVNARPPAASPGLRSAYQTDPARAGAMVAVGGAVTKACNVSVAVGVSYACGVPYDCWPSSCWWWGGCYPYYSWCWPFYGCGWWWGWGYPYYGYSSYWWRPYYDTYCYYYNSPPAYYGSVIYETVEQPVVVEEQPIEEEAVGEGVIGGRAANPQLDRLLKGTGADSLARASNHYLTLGDSAFRDNRYGDAVHFYAKAVEFAPTDGVLYLVLSDALFATGDYHYGAYALRKALELDPTLIDVVVDKRTFYSDATRFDQQLSVLEDYLRDHPADNDARLLLAANYLFSSRAHDAKSLLEEAGGAGVRADAAGALVYEASRNR